jgi:acyl carrier protein
MGLDSLDAVEMLVWAEEQYDIHTAPSDYLETQPIQQFIDVIYEKIISNK